MPMSGIRLTRSRSAARGVIACFAGVAGLHVRKRDWHVRLPVFPLPGSPSMATSHGSPASIRVTTSATRASSAVRPTKTSSGTCRSCTPPTSIPPVTPATPGGGKGVTVTQKTAHPRHRHANSPNPAPDTQAKRPEPPARHAGRSHHWQPGGPILVAEDASGWSHDRGRRHGALVAQPGSAEEPSLSGETRPSSARLGPSGHRLVAEPAGS